MESELVSGFMTEHAAVIFVFFFLAEYASIVLMCILISILFIGGYLFWNLLSLLNIINYVISKLFLIDSTNYIIYFSDNIMNNSLIEGLFYGLSLGLKSCIMVFIFIWVRASFPRIRFDQLMSFCWTILIPLVFALIILLPCILLNFDILSSSVNLW